MLILISNLDSVGYLSQAPEINGNILQLFLHS